MARPSKIRSLRGLPRRSRGFGRKGCDDLFARSMSRTSRRGRGVGRHISSRLALRRSRPAGATMELLDLVTRPGPQAPRMWPQSHSVPKRAEGISYRLALQETTYAPSGHDRCAELPLTDVTGDYYSAAGRSNTDSACVMRNTIHAMDGSWYLLQMMDRVCRIGPLRVSVQAPASFKLIGAIAECERSSRSILSSRNCCRRSIPTPRLHGHEPRPALAIEELATCS